MDRNTPRTVVGFFPTRAQAESATDELWHWGFTHDQIGMAIPGGTVHEATTGSEALEETAAGGTTKGALTGGIVGALAGASVASLLPGIGPILATGMLAGAAVGGAAGAAVGTFAGPFLAMGFSETEARRLGDEVKGGRTLLVVRAHGEPEADKVVEVVHSHGGQIDETALAAPR